MTGSCSARSSPGEPLPAPSSGTGATSNSTLPSASLTLTKKRWPPIRCTTRTPSTLNGPAPASPSPSGASSDTTAPDSSNSCTGPVRGTEGDENGSALQPPLLASAPRREGAASRPPRLVWLALLVCLSLRRRVAGRATVTHVSGCDVGSIALVTAGRHCGRDAPFRMRVVSNPTGLCIMVGARPRAERTTRVNRGIGTALEGGTEPARLAAKLSVLLMDRQRLPLKRASGQGRARTPGRWPEPTREPLPADAARICGYFADVCLGMVQCVPVEARDDSEAIVPPWAHAAHLPPAGAWEHLSEILRKINTPGRPRTVVLRSRR